MNPTQVVMGTLAIYLIAVLSPGLNFAMVSRLAVERSRQAGLGATLGIGIGATIYALLAMSGLSALLIQVSWLTRAVQLLAGCYLVYLGISTWLSAGRSETTLELGQRGSGFLDGIRAGVLVEFSNPKSIMFFVSLYAVSVPAASPLWVKGAILLGGFSIEVIWYGAVALLLSTERSRRAVDRARKPIERLFGGVLVALGLRLAWQSRSA